MKGENFLKRLLIACLVKMIKYKILLQNTYFSTPKSTTWNSNLSF